MVGIMAPARAAVFREQRLREEQREYAERGISAAFEGWSLVTISDSNCDYLNFKHFVTTQIFSLGIDNYISRTGWNKKELIEYLTTIDQYNDIWKDDILDFFDGMKGNY